MAEEKIFTIPLRKEFSKAPRNMRSKRAMTAIKEHVRKHMHAESVKIGPALNRLVWKRGIEKPPAFVRVKVRKEKESVYIEIIGAEFPAGKKAEEKGKQTEKQEDAAKAAPDADKKVAATAASGQPAQQQ